jgi:hypothetical protein
MLVPSRRPQIEPFEFHLPGQHLSDPLFLTQYISGIVLIMKLKACQYLHSLKRVYNPKITIAYLCFHNKSGPQFTMQEIKFAQITFV